MAKHVTGIPLLIVKANSAGKFHLGPQQAAQQQSSSSGAPQALTSSLANTRERLTVMCHLDSSQVGGGSASP